MFNDQRDDELLEFCDADQGFDPVGDSDFGLDLQGDDWAIIDDSEISDEDLAAPSAEQVRELLNGLAAQPAESNDDEIQSTPSIESAPEIPNVSEASEDSGVTVADLDDELREAFMDDASGCVGSMENALLRLESEPTDRDALNQICRELHTLKGASASVGLASLADQMHKLEDELSEDHQAERTPDVAALLETVDQIRTKIYGSTTDVDLVADSDPNVVPASTALPAFVDDGDDDETVRVKSSQLNRLMDMLSQLVMLRNRRANELSELQDVYHELMGSVSKMRIISNETEGRSENQSSLQLSEVANDVLEIAQNVRTCSRPISEGNVAVSQFIREFREELVALRRTPIGGLFRRLQRVVRDAAKAEVKQVRLELIGCDAGIERSLQQRLYEPLLHIIRNAVCHGIEKPNDRVSRGKDACGTISLTANSGPDLFVIEVRDDGRGLDYEMIRQRGIESGLLASDQMATRDELSQLIFKPGFSTRQTADQMAGRGVGMDVVNSTLQRMRGWLEVDSESDRGTRIRLSFPLPSVIQHAMVFRAAGQLFALPMQTIQATGGTGQPAASVVLASLLGNHATNATNPNQRITLAIETPGPKTKRITLLVDEIVGPEELVVRPLPALLKRHPYCTGATLSGMGNTVLFLDARRMLESYDAERAEGSDSVTAGPSENTKVGGQFKPKVLVVDDSISARKRVVRSLRRYPVEIVEANDGKQALDVMKRDSFAAVFSDMEMPHVSGMELLADVNANTDSTPPPVVIISSRSEDEFTGRARELGANNYLIKPLTDQALDDAVIGIPTLQHLSPQSIGR